MSNLFLLLKKFNAFGVPLKNTLLKLVMNQTTGKKEIK